MKAGLHVSVLETHCYPTIRKPLDHTSMSKRIYKYDLPLYPETYQQFIPQGSRVLSCGIQNDRLVVWFEVDPDKEVKLRKFEVVFTGFDRKTTFNHFVGTVTDRLGLVYHVFTEPDEQILV